ncbi:HNH endonuclease [Gillisia limnaea]|uniref:Phage related endodeoxyribonuclease n=1 Tax=Gillisia limnaea (strain DSM 15749 / LMG 21470 / R-8282) TaxID=865937 RepID=H2BX21_GILLR|nr:HNH endonuclease [Gillisia limnaea]EHQ01973.1 phage related endodeoxyribonuclease [Gillisia limnaea DSM 15749]
MIKNYRQEQWKTLHKETWQDRFVYKVSSYGRIISFVKNPEGEMLKGGKTVGYPSFVVHLKNGKKKNYYFHRVIAELFLDKAEDADFVIHKNYEKHENEANNLAWVNKAEWVQHQYGNPNVQENKLKRKLRKVTSYSKLSYAQAVILKKKLLDPNRKTRIRILAKQFGVSEMQLYRIKSGENWGDIKV